MAVFQEISFGQALAGASRDAMTTGNLTEMDAMVMDLLAGDDRLLAAVSVKGGQTDSVTGGNSAGYRLGDVLDKRILELRGEIRQLEQGAADPARLESLRYDLDFYTTLGDNPRYADLTISDAVDYSGTGVSPSNGREYTSYANMATFHLSDGDCVASFAGTGPEIDSWLEDGRMATTDTGVDAQKAAADYLNYVMEQNPDARFTVNGYSKGGNEALYAAIRCEDQERLAGVRNFDGPGFGDALLADPDFSARYEALRRRLGDDLYCLSPENSLVGHLMNDHGRYEYMDTNATVLADHDYTRWNWQADGSVARAQGRTELSIQVEAMMDGLIVRFSDEELDLIYDALRDLCLRCDIHTTGDLARLGMGEDGEFSLAVLAENLFGFLSDCSPRQRELLLSMAAQLLDPQALAMLASSALTDWLREQGIENPLGVSGTAVALQAGALLAAKALLPVLVPLLQVLLAAAAVAAVLWAVNELTGGLLARLGEALGQALQDICNGARALLEGAAGLVEGFLTRLRGELEKNPWFCAVRDLAVGGWQQLQTALETVAARANDGLDAFGRWAAQGLEQLRLGLRETARQGLVTLGALVEPVFTGALALVQGAFSRLRGAFFRWSQRQSGCTALAIDREMLGQALTLLRRADELTFDMAPRLRRLAGRLASEGIADGDGLIQTFFNLYHLTVADVVVDLHDDIDDMARRVAAVGAQYDEMKGTIASRVVALNG